MIKDLLVSFKENLQTKSSNPFFGTLILVWLFKNWDLFYSLFNFDDNATLIQKREFIVSHFTTYPFIETLLWCILESIIVLIISYFFINLSRLIVNFYEKRLTPLVYKWTDEKSIVLKSIYDISEDERKKLEKKLEEERSAKLKIQDDYERLEKKNSELIIKNAQLKTPNVKPDISKNSSIKNMSKLELLLNKLKDDGLINNFKEVASSILNNNPLHKSDKINIKLITLGLIIPGSYLSGPDYYRFTLSDVGKEIHEILLLGNYK